MSSNTVKSQGSVSWLVHKRSDNCFIWTVWHDPDHLGNNDEVLANGKEHTEERAVLRIGQTVHELITKGIVY